MNKLIEMYEKKSKDSKWMASFVSSANNASNRIFNYLDTNIRSFSTIETYFMDIKDKNLFEKDRSKWPKNKYHGQEEDKQKKVILEEAGLAFYNNKKLLMTKKGYAFDRFISSLKKNNKWLGVSLFCMDAHFNQKTGHIVRNAENFLRNNGLVKNLNELILEIDSPLFKKIKNPDFLKLDIFCILFLYFDNELVERFTSSDSDEKKEFVKFLIKEYGNSKKTSSSLKYLKGGSVYEKFLHGRQTLKSYKDDLLTILHYLIIKDTIKKLKGKLDIKLFKRIYLEKLNEIEKSYGYFGLDLNNLEIALSKFNSDSNHEILKVLYNAFIKLELVDEDLLQQDVQNAISIKLRYDRKEELRDKPIKIDIYETIDKSEFSKPKLKRNQSIIAQEIINKKFKCELDNIEERKCSYFISESTGKNYLEGHHLIPVEYWKKFKYSIDVSGNIVPLCPRCHRELHHGQKQRIKKLLIYLLREREKRLSKCNISLNNRNELLEMYNAT
jgi:hypothetical protein